MTGPRKISAADFKAKCLKLMDSIERDHIPIIITKRGRPVAKLVAYEETPTPSVFGCMAGTVTIVGDIVAPIDVEWDAQNE